MSTFKVKVPDGAMQHLLNNPSNTWMPSKSRFLQFPGRDEILEELLLRLLIRGSKLAGEPLIPLSCVLCRYDDGKGSCSVPLGEMNLRGVGCQRLAIYSLLASATGPNRLNLLKSS